MNLLDLLSDGSSERGFFGFDNGARVSTTQLWADSGRSALWFQRHVGAGNRVAAILTPCPSALSAIVGAFRSGSTLVSLPLPGRGMAIEEYITRTDAALKLVEARTILVEADYAPVLAALDATVCAFETTLTGDSARCDRPNSAEFIQFSSGTTADPVGVCLSLDAIGANVEKTLETLELRPGDSTLSWLPLSHDMGLVGMCLAPWAGGARRFSGGGNAFLMRPEQFLNDPLDWLRGVERESITISASPCFALDLVEHRFRARPEHLNLSSLRSLIVGAEPVYPQVLRNFERAFAESRLNPVALSPAYGLAEATLTVSLTRPEEPWQALRLESTDEVRFRPTSDSSGGEYVSSGAPLAGTEVRVTDGLIEIKSPSTLTTTIGRPSPLTADGWLQTSDIGLVDRGLLFVCGRRDDLISLRGRNVNALAIAAAAESVTPLRAGGVAAVLDADGQLVVVAELSQATDAPVRTLFAHVRRATAAETGVVPNRLILVTRGTLAKTPSGKPQRHRIQTALIREQLHVVASASTSW